MKLQALVPPETDEQEGYVAFYKSTDDLWRLGFYRVIFGVRVIAWRKGSISRAIDYCAGSDGVFAAELLATLATIFRRHLDDGATEAAVARELPGWTVRPINRDPCWERLQAMAQQPSNSNSNPTQDSMTPELQLALRQNAAARAHLHGAEWITKEKQAKALLEEAAVAKARYFRELEAVDLLAGRKSPFSALANGDT